MALPLKTLSKRKPIFLDKDGNQEVEIGDTGKYQNVPKTNESVEKVTVKDNLKALNSISQDVDDELTGMSNELTALETTVGELLRRVDDLEKMVKAEHKVITYLNVAMQEMQIVLNKKNKTKKTKK